MSFKTILHPLQSPITDALLGLSPTKLFGNPYLDLCMNNGTTLKFGHICQYTPIMPL